jgi:formiminotetrahydrofolate cyclodeaminase
MSYRSETPFDNIESSHEYVSLLAKAIEDAVSEVEADIALAGADGAQRRKEALQLVLYNLTKLNSHMVSTRRILNDLRTLRRLLLEERTLNKVYRQAGE